MVIMICRHAVRPMDVDPSHVIMAVSTPQTSQVGEHPTRKAVPRQLDFTTMYGDPAGPQENSVRTPQPSLYGTKLLLYIDLSNNMVLMFSYYTLITN